MVMVCDAIMGTGKSSAAIAYMNEHPNDKFIYITPYLDEANRITNGCPDLHFVEPSNKLEKYKHKKYLHTMALIEEGRNISTTHQAFKRYTQETLNNIKQQGYTLIIDENVDVLETFDFHTADLQLAVDAGYIEESGNEYFLTDSDYNGEALAEMFGLLRSRRLIKMNNENGEMIFYWTLPSELMTAFKDVFILTYLFKGQSLYYFMKIHNISYKHIGIEKIRNAEYRFCDTPQYIPEYVSHLKDMIDILDNPKMNEIGENKFALSLSWYSRGGENVERIKKNMNNFFNNICRDIPSDKKLWGSFNDARNKIKGKGYTKSFLNFNSKATNAYRDRNCLAYPVNLFMNVNEKKFYQMNGIHVDEDIYALSIMVQWIWRSEIRDGERIQLYIPSKRMRNLLINWIDNTSKGGK